MVLVHKALHKEQEREHKERGHKGQSGGWEHMLRGRPEHKATRSHIRC